MTTLRKKLIEVALPLDAINKASAREKSIRHGHPSTLHLWWARRPLAAARAVIFAQMVDDPSAHPDLFPTEKAQEKERQRLFRIIEDLVLWENTTNETVLQQARDEIWQSWRYTCAENADHPRAKELFDRYKLPAFHDPFAGGGSLPLEAQRLGLEAYASDLNPVAVLINKAMIEIPPKFAGRPPVNPKSAAEYLGARASRPHKEWHSRGYLPHFDHPRLVQSISFRLHDSVPSKVISVWREELELGDDVASDDPRMAELRERVARYEDAGHGACYLRDERIAELVQNALFHFDGERYRLLTWCIMHNHVHVLVETMQGWPLGDVVHSWKSFTAKEANKVLGRSGKFWMKDYFDRFIRDEFHFAGVKEYIENNPVKAGLCRSPEEWRFSALGSRLSGSDGAPGTGAFPGLWKGAQGLAEDVRYYGKWMRDEAEKRIGYLYPKVEVTADMASIRPDLKKYVGRKLTVIAWLWARTVKSPNPAFAQVDVPLASTFMLSTKAGKEAYVEPVLGTQASGLHKTADGTSALPGYRFTVKVGKPKDAEAVKRGTKLSRGANFQCLMSGTPIAGDYIKAEGKAGRMGARLMAIVTAGERGRVYLAPTPEMEAVARTAEPTWVPEGSFVEDARAFTPFIYGLKEWRHLFTPRQLLALGTLSNLVEQARERIRCDALAAGLSGDDRSIESASTGAVAYSDTIAVYLAFGISRLTMRCSSLAAWDSAYQKIQNTFGRQALSMVWDFCEGNPFSNATGNFESCLVGLAEALEALPNLQLAGKGFQSDAQNQVDSRGKVVSTDPPYYDNVPYADLSDFFYVWLRRSLKSVFPELFATLAVPKAEELVAFAYRHGSKADADAFFLDGMTKAMHRLAEQGHPAFPVTIYYAFKQSESDDADGTASTGWETFLDAAIRAGLAVTGTWPMRTEMKGRVRDRGDSNALASSIVLVCRSRADKAPTATRREFITTLRSELPLALAHLQRGNIAPVDLAQAAIGPGMAVYTRYAKVLDAEGKPLSVREALSLINQTLDEALAEQEGDFDADSRWALAWFEQSGFAEGEYGVAETLSKAKNTSVAGMVDAGILASGHGKVRLLRPEELAADWDPGTDKRMTAWEVVHQLIRALEAGGEGAAAALVTKLGSKAEIARELAYRLYTLCERKKRAAEALSYNGLVQSWPEIIRLAREGAKPRETQTTMFEEN
ncbi:MAG: DUF1156 domain-containing protein [Proteobacteria bacterium]|nr:DUF1156 domain-containing protein [Pseudomonadota bacterium]